MIRGRRVFGAMVVVAALTAAEGHAAGLRPTEVTDPADSRIERPSRDIVALPGRIRKFVVKLFHEITVPIPAPKP